MKSLDLVSDILPNKKQQSFVINILEISHLKKYLVNFITEFELTDIPYEKFKAVLTLAYPFPSRPIPDDLSIFSSVHAWEPIDENLTLSRVKKILGEPQLEFEIKGKYKKEHLSKLSLWHNLRIFSVDDFVAVFSIRMLSTGIKAPKTMPGERWSLGGMLPFDLVKIGAVKPSEYDKLKAQLEKNGIEWSPENSEIIRSYVEDDNSFDLDENNEIEHLQLKWAGSYFWDKYAHTSKEEMTAAFTANFGPLVKAVLPGVNFDQNVIGHSTVQFFRLPWIIHSMSFEFLNGVILRKDFEKIYGTAKFEAIYPKNNSEVAYYSDYKILASFTSSSLTGLSFYRDADEEDLRELLQVSDK